MKWRGNPPGRPYEESIHEGENNDPAYCGTDGSSPAVESCRRTSAIETSTPSSRADPYPKTPKTQRNVGPCPRRISSPPSSLSAMYVRYAFLFLAARSLSQRRVSRPNSRLLVSGLSPIESY